MGAAINTHAPSLSLFTLLSLSSQSFHHISISHFLPKKSLSSLYKHCKHFTATTIFILHLPHFLQTISTMATLYFYFVSLILTSLCNFSLSMTTITAMAKDQISCTMCSSCDNPCQPIFSPPPPPIPSPPPPSPPPPSLPDCPPPPSSPSGGGGVYYFSPPPPVQPSAYPPPYVGGGGDSYYPPATPHGYLTPPPNPIVSYFPYYYYNPPPGSANSGEPRSVQFRSRSIVSSLVVTISLLLFLWFSYNYILN